MSFPSESSVNVAMARLMLDVASQSVAMLEAGLAPVGVLLDKSKRENTARRNWKRLPCD